MRDEGRGIRHARVMAAWFPLMPPMPARPPKCFDSMGRFEEWVESAQVISKDGFCEDCTRGMQKEMIKAGRCEFPDTDFPGVRDFDESVRGKNPVDLHPDAAVRVEKRDKRAAALRAKKAKKKKAAANLKSEPQA